MTALIPRERRCVRIGREEYALSPKTASGRVRGRPVGRPTRSWPSRGSSIGESPHLAGGDQADQRKPGPVDGLVDLRTQPAPGAADAVVGRLLTRIRVARSSPEVWRLVFVACWWVRAVVESTSNRPVLQRLGVGGRGVLDQDRVPGALGGHASASGPHLLAQTRSPRADPARESRTGAGR